MNLEHLKIFIAVAERGSFARASEDLYISLSTTSRNVAALEDELGVPLLVRENRRVTLTSPGQTLCREGKKIIKKTEAVEAAVRAAGKNGGK